MSIDRSWPSAGQIQEVHAQAETRRWDRRWSCFDLSGCEHPLRIGQRIENSAWDISLCVTCGDVKSQCVHETFEWNEAGTLLRCTTCGVDGT